MPSFVVYFAEHPTNPEFATFGDSLWWGIVTLTTVGYGDNVPKTSRRRWAAIMIMITSVAVLGMLSGSLASFFRIDHIEHTDQPSAGANASAEQEEIPDDLGGVDGAVRLLTNQVSALRDEVRELRTAITGTNRTATDL